MMKTTNNQTIPRKVELGKKHDFLNRLLYQIKPSQKNRVIVREFDTREFQKVVVHVHPV